MAMISAVDILTLEEWADDTDFDTWHRKEKLTCRASFSQSVLPQVRYHARLCPRAFAIHDPTNNLICLQQHAPAVLKLHHPSANELKLQDKGYSQDDLRFSHLVPAAKHHSVRDDFLLCFELPQDNLFIIVSQTDEIQSIFTVPLQVELNVLACAQNSGHFQTVAILSSCQSYFDKFNSLNIDIFQENQADYNLNSVRHSELLWLKKMHTVQIFLSCLPNVIGPLLLFHPVFTDTLVCFNVNSKKDDGQIPSGISEYNIQRKEMVSKTNLFGLLGGLSPLRAKFLTAVFSPDGSVLVVGCSAKKDPELSLHYASYVLFDSVSYTVFSKLELPLHNHVLPCSRFRDDCMFLHSVICCKSYSPLFSQCGQKMALLSCESPSYTTETGSHEEEVDLTAVHIYKLPLQSSLQNQCRVKIRGWIKFENLEQLPLPNPLKRYLLFS